MVHRKWLDMAVVIMQVEVVVRNKVEIRFIFFDLVAARKIAF